MQLGGKLVHLVKFVNLGYQILNLIIYFRNISSFLLDVRSSMDGSSSTFMICISFTNNNSLLLFLNRAPCLFPLGEAASYGWNRIFYFTSDAFSLRIVFSNVEPKLSPRFSSPKQIDERVIFIVSGIYAY